MKKSFSFLFTLVVTFTALFGQADSTPPADSPLTQTYTYYPLFSKEWIGNKYVQLACEFPTVVTITETRGQIDDWSFNEFNSYKNALNTPNGAPSHLTTPTTRKEDAEGILRYELSAFLIEAGRVAFNINGFDREAAKSLLALPAYADLKNQLDQNWDSTTRTYSVNPSHHQLQKMETLLGHCEETQLTKLAAALNFSADELAQYNAFRVLQSTIDPNDSVTLSQFRFASLEYINVLLARRISVYNEITATDGFDALNHKLLNLNLHAADYYVDELSIWVSGSCLNLQTLCFDAKDDMHEYEYHIYPAL